MRINTNDLTVQRNYLERYQFLMKEYELVKQKKHSIYKQAQDFTKQMIPVQKAF